MARKGSKAIGYLGENDIDLPPKKDLLTSFVVSKVQLTSKNLVVARSCTGPPFFSALRSGSHSTEFLSIGATVTIAGTPTLGRRREKQLPLFGGAFVPSTPWGLQEKPRCPGIHGLFLRILLMVLETKGAMACYGCVPC